MRLRYSIGSAAALVIVAGAASAQLTSVGEDPTVAAVPGGGAGIGLSLEDQEGTSPDDHGNVNLPGSSAYIISRDPARAVRRGRQIFQRKFRVGQGFGPLTDDGVGQTGLDLSRNAGLVDSCAGCHGRPRGAAGFGGDVATRPDSRDSPQLFGLGLREMLGDEITADLRAIRDNAIAKAQARHRRVTARLKSKGIRYGKITAYPDGSVDTSRVEGVNADLRVRPFFAQGGTISMREFLVGAFNAEMGLEASDIDLIAAQSGPVTTPAGMVLDGTVDFVEGTPAPDPTTDVDGDGVTGEIATSIVDFFEFYLLNYFKPGTGRQTIESLLGRAVFSAIGCSDCHRPNLRIDRDRRIADVETVYDPVQGNPINPMFATATVIAEADPGVPATDDDPPGLRALGGSFLVRNFFGDLKRHDLGPNFHERNFVGFTAQVSPLVEPPPDPEFGFTTQFMTEPLWGVGSSPPYGHDGRSADLRTVILRHGGEADRARDRFARLRGSLQGWVIDFLNTLVLFPPDDTSSNLNPADDTVDGYPQLGHGSINLGALFTTPGPE